MKFCKLISKKIVTNKSKYFETKIKKNLIRNYLVTSLSVCRESSLLLNKLDRSNTFKKSIKPLKYFYCDYYINRKLCYLLKRAKSAYYSLSNTFSIMPFNFIKVFIKALKLFSGKHTKIIEVSCLERIYIGDFDKIFRIIQTFKDIETLEFQSKFYYFLESSLADTVKSISAKIVHLKNLHRIGIDNFTRLIKPEFSHFWRHSLGRLGKLKSITISLDSNEVGSKISEQKMLEKLSTRPNIQNVTIQSMFNQDHNTDVTSCKMVKKSLLRMNFLRSIIISISTNHESLVLLLLKGLEGMRSLDWAELRIECDQLADQFISSLKDLFQVWKRLKTLILVFSNSDRILNEEELAISFQNVEPLPIKKTFLDLGWPGKILYNYFFKIFDPKLLVHVHFKTVISTDLLNIIYTILKALKIAEKVKLEFLFLNEQEEKVKITEIVESLMQLSKSLRKITLKCPKLFYDSPKEIYALFFEKFSLSRISFNSPNTKFSGSLLKNFINKLKASRLRDIELIADLSQVSKKDISILSEFIETDTQLKSIILEPGDIDHEYMEILETSLDNHRDRVKSLL